MHKPNHTQESDQLLRLGQKGGNFSNLGTRALRQCLCAHTQHPKLAKCWCNGTGKAPCALVRFAPKGGRGNLGPSVTGPTRAKIDQKGVQTHSRKIKLTRDSVLISNSTRLDSIKKKEGSGTYRPTGTKVKRGQGQATHTIPYSNYGKKGRTQLIRSG